jgi:hypothetical protein
MQGLLSIAFFKQVVFPCELPLSTSKKITSGNDPANAQNGDRQQMTCLCSCLLLNGESHQFKRCTEDG